MDTPKLIIISAPSGAGKTTLCSRLLEAFPERFVLSISSTTRHPRGFEVNGREYHFITEDEFKDGIKNNFFAEWALVHGHYYGTSKKIIDTALTEGKSVILDIDVQGAAKLRRLYRGRCLSVFISPPTMGELRNRLVKRGTEKHDVLEKRLSNAQGEMKQANEFDFVVVNDDLESAYRQLEQIVVKALQFSSTEAQG